MYRRFVRICVVLALAGCDAGVVTRTVDDVAYIEITAPQTIGYQETATAAAATRAADGEVVSGIEVEWQSLDERIITVSGNGSITAARPGVATLVARVGTLSDSVEISVVTSNCPTPWVRAIDVDGNGFQGSLIWPGWMDHDNSEPGITKYSGTPFFWGAGVMFGTHSDSTLISYYYYVSNMSDFDIGGRVCQLSESPMHTLARLELSSLGRAGTPPVIPGLAVVQEQWAFGNTEDHGYVLFRYEFKNTRPSPIEGLSVGVISDFDVDGAANVGGFDPTTQTAYVMAPDSLSQPMVAGTVLIGSEVQTYVTAPPNSARPDRAGHYALLTHGVSLQPDPTVKDVKHVLAADPIDIYPGETEEVWFAFVVGADRTSFEANVAAARSMVETVR